jgi:prophage antirepressor-like protein
MNEEIKEDNNCIVKAFENNPISIIAEEINNKKIYLFKVSDIGNALKLTNIRVSIQNYDEGDEVVVRKAYDTIKRNQDTLYLTSQGVYRLLYTSKKEVAKKFRKWAGAILDDIIFNESIELKKKLEEKDRQHRIELEEKEQFLIEHKEQTELEKEVLLEKTLLSQFPINTQCIYYGKIDNKDSVGGNLIKFGMSNNLQERVKVHKKTYTNFRLINVFKVSNQIEIENCIKKHSILKQRIRNIMINEPQKQETMNYRELICIDANKKDPEFSLEKLNEYINAIIDENQYNIENYKKLIEQNTNLEKELYQLKDEYKILQEQNNKLQKQLDKFTPSLDENKFKTHNRIETSGGYSLFAFECSNLRYKIGLCKTATIETREKVYKATHPTGEMKLHVKIKHPFVEKTMMYLLKRHLTFLNSDTFDGSLDNIKSILQIISKLEDLVINNDLNNINNRLCGEIGQQTELNDPEIPFIKKSKRSIDQIEKDTGNVIATYPSIEAAGRALGLTTGTAVGIALRNKSLCQGFLFRYSGVSKEDQMSEQPVIRINCKTGEKTNYPNIASAAKQAKISPPGLRNRILTDIHINNFHWVFDKSANHYTN